MVEKVTDKKIGSDLIEVKNLKKYFPVRGGVL